MLMPSSSRFLPVLLCTLLLSSATPALAKPPSGKQPPRNAKPAVESPVYHSEEERLIARQGFSPSNVGFLLVDLDSGEVLRNHREREPFIPASVAKVPSTLAALHILGGEFTFNTSLRAKGAINQGRLAGDLYLKGSGDPSLSLSQLMDMAGQLRQLGVHHIDGSFFYDDSALIPSPNISDEQNEDEEYNPGVGALNLDFNRVKLHWAAQGKSGGLLTSVMPDLGYVHLTPGVRQRGEMQRLIFLGGEGGRENWQLAGGSRGGEMWLPIKNPSLYTALVFRHFCQALGIDLPPPRRGIAPAAYPALVEHKSPPLSFLAEKALEFSNNLWTELIGVTAAIRLSGKPLSIAQSGEVLTRWWEEHLPEVDWRGCHLTGSCGLSPANRITPRQIVEILKYGEQPLPGGGRYFSLLPISGWKGTLNHHLSGTETALKVWAKTGTIHYGRGLAGYILPGGGRRLAFSVFVSDPTKRALFDERLGHHTVQEVEQAAGWKGRAGGLIYSLVEKWVRRP